MFEWVVYLFRRNIAEIPEIFVMNDPLGPVHMATTIYLLQLMSSTGLTALSQFHLVTVK